MVDIHEIYDKYYARFYEDPIRACVIRAFYSAANDKVYAPAYFRTMNDGFVRGILDDEDYAIWEQKKSEWVQAMEAVDGQGPNDAWPTWWRPIDPKDI